MTRLQAQPLYQQTKLSSAEIYLRNYTQVTLSLITLLTQQSLGFYILKLYGQWSSFTGFVEPQGSRLSTESHPTVDAISLDCQPLYLGFIIDRIA